ncbi:MAG: hypothetical protein GY797_32780, partial [Deltaproteobacteria bacterium]|nr:hypothetical protein [Deltaproteobacteria bacterium]
TLFGCDQALVTNLLTHVKGLLIHANAIVHNGNGFLLAGTTGSGKSTLTQMMEKEGFQVVADDRMIIKMETNHDAVMHGSWFHGTTPTISKGRHHLTSIFFLEQADENKIIPIEHPQEKISKLLQSVVRPHVQAKAWNNLLDTVEELILSIDCYRLKFDLSGDIILSIKKIVK